MRRALVTVVREALTAAGVRRGARVVAAVSGGKDSMVLFHVLARLAPTLGLRVHIAHIHHGLRTASADRDAALVCAEAAQQRLPITVERLDPRTRARGTSVEAWARDVRYARLEAIRRRARAGWILTAHTQNDQAETVLLNLLRGTGLRGIAGIPRRRERILRPLLSVPRAEIEAYAASHGVTYREDPTNRSAAHRRNRIRHELLPLLAREYNPRIVESLATGAALAREDDDVLAAGAAALARRAIRRRGRGVRLEVGALHAAPPALARRLLQEAFRRVAPGGSLTRRHLAALWAALSDGKGTVLLPGGVRAWASSQCVWVGTAASKAKDVRTGGASASVQPAPEVVVRPGGWVRWAPGRCAVRVRRMAGDVVGRLRRRDPAREILSAKLLNEPLRLRAWQPGDRFRPLGLHGRKKLQDFFVDAKVPRDERSRVPVLLAGDRIAWVVGHRIADEFRWEGGRVACIAEVRCARGRHGLPTGSPTPVSR